jgi:anti-anti-sigma regulatory factor
VTEQCGQVRSEAIPGPLIVDLIDIHPPGVEGTAQCRVTSERGAVVTVTGTVDARAVAMLRTRLDAAAGHPGTEVVAVDLSAAKHRDPALFEVLAMIETQLLVQRARLAIVGLRGEALTYLDEEHLWAVSTLYRAARDRISAVDPEVAADR